MPDSTTTRIELLQKHQEGKDHIARMRSLIDVLTLGGAEGVQKAANDDPELLLTAINSLMNMIEHLQQSNDDLLEYWLSSLDGFEDIARLIYKTKE